MYTATLNTLGGHDDYQEFLVHFKSVAKASVKPITISPNEEHIHHNQEEMPTIKSEPLLISLEDPADKVKAAINLNKVEEDVILSTNIHSDHFENDFFFDESGDSSLEDFPNSADKEVTENNTITKYVETEKKVDEEFVDLLSNEAEADLYVLDDFNDVQEFLNYLTSVAKATVKPITISPNEEYIHYNKEEMPTIKDEQLLISIEDPADKVKAAINLNKVEEDVILSTNIHSDHFENDFFFDESGDSSLEDFPNSADKEVMDEKSDDDDDDSDDSNIYVDILPDEVSGSDIKALGNHFDEENESMLSQLGENNTITKYMETKKKADEGFVDLLSNEAEADSYILDNFNDVQEFLNYFTSVAKATVKPITLYPDENHIHHNEEELSTIKSKPFLFSLKDPADKVKAAINLNKVEEDVTLSTNAQSDYFENDFFFDESGDSSLEDFPNSADKEVMDEKSDGNSNDSHIYVDILPDEVNESDDKVLGNHYENLHHNVEEVPTFGDDDFQGL